MKPSDLFTIMNNAKTEKEVSEAEGIFKVYFAAYSDEEKKEVLGRLAISEYSMSMVDKTKAFIDRIVNITPGNVIVDELGSLYCTLIGMVCLSKVMAEQFEGKSSNEINFEKLDKAFPDGNKLFDFGKEMFQTILPLFSKKLSMVLEMSNKSEEAVDKNNL